jgi:hypothetical protein
MIRIEIIANHSVEENILEALRNEGAGKYYTKYPAVFGVGSAGPRMGDAVWPEENFALVIWCEEEEARGIERAVATVKARFPGEGIKLFGLSEGRQAVWMPPRQMGPDTVQAPKTPDLPGDGPEDPNAE